MQIVLNPNLDGLVVSQGYWIQKMKEPLPSTVSKALVGQNTKGNGCLPLDHVCKKFCRKRSRRFVSMCSRQASCRSRPLREFSVCMRTNNACMVSCRAPRRQAIATGAVIVRYRHSLKVTGHSFISRRVARIIWIAKTDGQGEDVIASLGRPSP